VLEIGDRLRDRGLGHCELDCGLSHAAGLCDGEQNVQVAQLDPPTDPIAPMHEDPYPNGYDPIE